MAVWQDNFRRLLSQKEVLILHGNVRDSAYIKKDGGVIPGFTALIRQTAKDLGFDQAVSWGVFFDNEDQAHAPMWSLERIDSLQSSEQIPPRSVGSQDRELNILSRWVAKDSRDVSSRSVFIIHYLDKLTPYSARGTYPKDIALLITMIQKLIENMTPNNRLILVALQDTMVPLDYYTHSPRVAVLEIPLPDKEERGLYFARSLSPKGLPRDQIDLMANVSDGLYVRDLENILRDVIGEQQKTPEFSYSSLKRIVDRYRLGTEEDPWSKLPLDSPPKGLLDSAESWFKERVIGQDEAVHEVVRAIKMARAGVVGLASGRQTKPKALFVFAGASGVGKTFLAKKLAEYLFDTEEAFLRFDMSEFKEEHTISKLIGSPPGYVGFERGGMLTNALKSAPFCVILFDELEKAHPRILDIFLQILDDGRLTDSRGQTVFFTESVIIFTSNIGTRTTDSANRPTSEKDRLSRLENISEPVERAGKVREHFLESVRDFFMYEISRPELLNRIGSHIIAFNYLDQAAMQRKIIRSKLDDIAVNFRDRFSHLGYRLHYHEAVADYFYEKHHATIGRLGGRGLVNAIDDEIGHLLAEQLLYAEQLKMKEIVFLVILNEKRELLCRRES